MRVPAALALSCSFLAITGLAAQKTPPFSVSRLDQLIRAEWNQRKITPSAPADDAAFLRRASLDITGVIPSPEAVTKFLADTSRDKRARAVQSLLDSPRYAEYWAAYWDDVLMGHQRVPGQVVDRVTWKRWLQEQFEKNLPWDEFTRRLLTAQGQNSPGGSYARAAGMMLPADRDAESKADPAEAAKVNGAVNFFLKYAQNPADLSGAISKTFLGVQIQCAQCHDHKTEKWKQEDFRRFTACFARTRPVPLDTGKVQGVRRVALRDVGFAFRPGRGMMAEYASATPAALDGTEFLNSPNRREALAAWITSRENPWFAEAIVNRMWAHFLGRGFVEPINDFRESNPAVMPHLLKLLARDFQENHYDLKRLIRIITASEVYQLSSGPGKNIDPENAYWARYRLKPLGPIPLLSSLIAATGAEQALERIAGARLEQLKLILQRQFVFLFDVDEETEQKEFEGTISQALLLLNGGITNGGVAPVPGSALNEILRTSSSDSEIIQALYLRTLSRLPTAAELKQWTEFLNRSQEDSAGKADASPAPPQSPREARRQRLQELQRMRQLARQAQRPNRGGDPLAALGNRLQAAQAHPKQRAAEDLFWALLNSSEFAFNH